MVPISGCVASMSSVCLNRVTLGPPASIGSDPVSPCSPQPAALYFRACKTETLHPSLADDLSQDLGKVVYSGGCTKSYVCFCV
jgi:hypothetical protein